MKERIYLFDNVKVVLIFLVVFGHLIEGFIYDGQMYIVLYTLIYSFHMPLFALVSGYFSRKLTKHELINLVKLFLIFELIYALLMGAGLMFQPERMQMLTGAVDANVDTTILHYISLLLSPIWILWYLLSAIFWKFSLQLFGNHKAMIIVAVVISLLIGMVDIPGRTLSYERTFAFLPFFLVGYYVTYEQIDKYKKSMIAKILVVVTVILTWFIIPMLVDLGPTMLYFANSYHELGQSMLQGVIYRFILSGYAMLMCLSVIVLVPNKELPFSYMGKHTLGIYLMHGLVMLLLVITGFFQLLYPLGYVINISSLFLLTVLICIMFGNEYTSMKIFKITYQKTKERNV